jgi:hypothetical protein
MGSWYLASLLDAADTQLAWWVAKGGSLVLHKIVFVAMKNLIYLDTIILVWRN